MSAVDDRGRPAGDAGDAGDAEDTAVVGAGVLVAVGLAVLFFAGWSWWIAAGLALAAGGVGWLRFPAASGKRDRQA